MIVGVAALEIQIHGSNSLKEKRGVVQSICRRLRNRFPMAVAEVGGQDLWQRGTVGAALVTTDGRLARSMLDRIAGGIGRDGEVELLSSRVEFFHPEGSETA